MNAVGSCAKCAYSIVSATPDSTRADLISAYNATRSYNTIVNVCSSLGLANISSYENTAAPNGTTAIAFVAQKTSDGSVVGGWRGVGAGVLAGLVAVGSVL